MIKIRLENKARKVLSKEEKQYTQGRKGGLRGPQGSAIRGTTATWRKWHGENVRFQDYEFKEFATFFPERSDGKWPTYDIAIGKNDNEPKKQSAGDVKLYISDLTRDTIAKRTDVSEIETAILNIEGPSIDGILVNLSGRQGDSLEKKIVGFNMLQPGDSGDTEVVQAICIPLEEYYLIVHDFEEGVDAVVFIKTNENTDSWTHAFFTLNQIDKLFNSILPSFKEQSAPNKYGLGGMPKTSGTIQQFFSTLETGAFYAPAGIERAFNKAFSDAKGESRQDPIKLILDLEFGYISNYPDWIGGAGGDENTKEAFWRFMFYNNSFMDFNFTLRSPGTKRTSASMKMGASDTHPNSFDWNPLDDSKEVRQLLFTDEEFENKWGGVAGRVDKALSVLYQEQPDGFFRGSTMGGSRGFGLVGPDVKTTEDFSKPVAVIKGSADASGGISSIEMDEQAVQLYLTRSKHQTTGKDVNLFQGWIVFAGAAYVSDSLLNVHDLEADEMIDTKENYIRQAGFVIGNLLGNYIDAVNKKTFTNREMNVKFELGKVSLNPNTLRADDDFKRLYNKGFPEAVSGGMRGHSFYAAQPNYENARNSEELKGITLQDNYSGEEGFMQAVSAYMSQSSQETLEQKYENLAAAFRVSVNHIKYTHYYIETMRAARGEDATVSSEILEKIKQTFKKNQKKNVKKITNFNQRFDSIIGGGSAENKLDEGLKRSKKRRGVTIRRIL